MTAPHETALDVRCPSGDSNKESADDYSNVVTRLNPEWRVIVCKDQIQWILQRIDGKRHGRTRWVGRSYLRDRNVLTRVCRTNVGEIDPIALLALAALPEMIGVQS
jgi:hypothetical protein